ncbi:5-oxoprolinase [Yarrowia sp. B02]|nr:5-oxoprolinase [Yarrowia sp. B02]
MGGIRIAIDRGGTFTDVYAHCPDQEIVLKLLSVDPANYEDAPTEGIRRILEKATGTKIPKGEPIDLSEVESVRMGTTVATNALLERKGDRVAFLVTKGFGDILTIGQQARPNIFDLSVKKLKKLYEVVFEVDERVVPDAAGEVTGATGEKYHVTQAPEKAAVVAELEKIKASGIESLAIAFMHGYSFTEHEETVAKWARELGFEVSVSHELQPQIKLVSRANSATASAYLSPTTRRYITQFGKGFKGGLDEVGRKLLFMQSDGGLTHWNQFSGLKAILSGPAGGVVGFSRTAYDDSQKPPKPVLGFDMGGTSTDVSRYAGTLPHIFETTTAQVTIQSPQLDISTVAAGGGSILFWRNGLFTVGPESASAHPGPACYRKGGPLTVTDANLFLGRLVVSQFPNIFGPNENEPLDSEIVKTKFQELTDEINRDQGSDLTPHNVALGFLQVANETMCRPIRSLTEGKGYITSGHDLCSFGGAGGQHACDVAQSLGISRVVIPKYSSILSAYGMALADVVVDTQQPADAILGDNVLGELKERLAALAKEATATLVSQGFTEGDVQCEKYLNLRYRGSESLMMVAQQGEGDFASFSKQFTELHKQEFGFTLDRDILVADVRVRAVGKTGYDAEHPIQELTQAKTNGVTTPKTTTTQKVYFDESWHDCSVFKIADLQTGDQVAGPALIIDATQTLVVASNGKATVLDNHVIIELDETVKEIDSGDHIDLVELSIFSHRFMSIAEQMGQTLQKTAISTNIKERLDFSCALFDQDGDLVANAPHIPVHLGSMSSAVRYQVEHWKGDLHEGDVLVCNHPAYGGSHLPDITVVTPVFDETGKVAFFCASRGHHSDIGGISAGSMPPFSKELWEEGATIQAFKVVSKGKYDEAGMVRLLFDEPSKFPGCEGSRSLQDSLSDLQAQIAANNKGIRLIEALIEDFGLNVVQKYMKAIQQNAEEAVRKLLIGAREKRETTIFTARDQLDEGTPIVLTITIADDGSAKFDFSGTGPQVYGNLNAPKSVTYSAILYVLRSLIDADIPLNGGCLKPIEIVIPSNTVLAPSADAATVGGNVETSQRVTDVVLKAFEAMGASQGTCNNLTFGISPQMLRDPECTATETFGYYETIAGGAGAGPTWNGQSGVQVHMTNTRSTDPEIFEKRYPAILREFSVRTGSGGAGEFTGGNGVVRDIQFTQPVQCSILSERRSSAPYGMKGGESGKSGVNLWVRKNGTTVTLGGKNTVRMALGERIIIQTPGGGGYGVAKEEKSSKEEAKEPETHSFIPRASGSIHERAAAQGAL